jgi:helicase
MSANSLSSLFETEEVRDLIRQADTDSLALELELSAKFVEDEEKTIPPLRLAAIASITSLLSNTSLDAWLREREQTNLESDNNILTVFVNWNSYISYLITSSLTPDIDDLIYFATSGLLAKRPNEVRDLLRIKKTDKWFGSIAENVAKSDWLTKVRSNISLAILFIIRQQNHQDIKKAGEILKELSDLQKQVEAEWLHNRTNPQRDALKLLGYYNLAQAVLRTSEFLLVGSVEANGRIVNDIAGELRRLLVRAEEFLQLASDSEAMLWLTVVGISLALLRESSIWVQAKGISERIDGLLGELVSMAREQPIFSLLPSQQDAIRQSLLDRSKMVIILQMPTSAGKTLLAEFSIVQTFDAYRGSSKVVYVVPTRALATQVRRILLEDLGPLGIKVSAAGSAFEEDPYELELLLNTDGVVVATPEKLDLLLRAHQEWFKDLRLIVVDEAHLISESERGVRLELLLANIRREQPEARLLLLTPFIENAKEIATWLSRERGISIQIQWRPSKILLGLAMVSNTGKNKNLSISWKDPFNPFLTPKPLSLPVSPSYNKTQSNRERIIFFADIFKKIGSVLAIFSSSPSAAEETAHKVAMECISLPVEKRTPQLRLAIALALKEYGTDSRFLSIILLYLLYFVIL